MKAHESGYFPSSTHTHSIITTARLVNGLIGIECTNLHLQIVSELYKSCNELKPWRIV